MLSGDLFVEVASSKQAQQILKLHSLSTISVSVKPHETLRSSKVVITCGRLLNLPIEEITQELRGQGVKDGRRINIRRDVAGHESTGCTVVKKCVNCKGQHTSFSRSCPKWKQEKEVVATKYQNNISFPEARRLVKALAPPDGRSYASVVDKTHPVYQTTHCPHCNHVVTMSNFPSISKSSEPVAIASSSGTKNILPQPSSQTSAVPPNSQDSSRFTIVNRKKNPKISSKSPSAHNNQIKANTATKFWKKSPQTSATEKPKTKTLKNKTDKNKISTAKTANSTSVSRVKEIPQTLTLT
ncbi:hypothetical protein AVEN_240337-1 [Araneus ventricosus]|uniref:Pre-C2HC domain-containing protein n=1 Tax=Araneus ventricosus TaxID=182803 RepID=A0A4Y2F3Q0_ARAVE|nr:hypothetical protein AVEN_240337-1 [Araneus ventricosus]